MKPWYVFTLLIFLPAVISAQRPAERNFLHNPLWNERHHVEEGESRYINSFGGWGGFGNFGLRRDTHHLWHQDLGAFIELYRHSDRRSFVFTGQIEFIADPHNDINFNPRAIFWEEGFMYTWRGGGDYFLQLGFYHRCKHDIDNLGRGEERSLVYSSLWGRWLQPFSLINSQDLIFALRYDRYLITWDNRIFGDDHTQIDFERSRWDELTSGISMNLHWQSNPGRKGNGYYIEPRIWVSRLQADFRINHGVNAGLNVRTEGAEFRVGLEYEYLHDSGIPANPADVHLISFGIKAIPAFGIR